MVWENFLEFCVHCKCKSPCFRSERCREYIVGKRSQAAAQHAPVAKGYEEIDRRLTEFIERELKDKEIPALSIVVVDGDQIVLAKGFGAASADGKQPATADSIYRVGSVSKLFTDVCVMQLVAAGKLDLDADVRKYLPDFAPHNPFGVPITLRQLMSHQSGFVRESPVGHYFDDTSPSLAATDRQPELDDARVQAGHAHQVFQCGRVGGRVGRGTAGRRTVRERMFARCCSIRSICRSAAFCSATR